MAPFASPLSFGVNSEHSGGSMDKPSVQFSLDHNEIALIPKLNEFTPKEIADCFYTSDDYKKMKSKDRVLVRLMKKGRFDDQSCEYCLRGIALESNKLERQSRIQRVQAIVLSSHNKDHEDDGDHQLAEMLAKATLSATEEALARAQEDAQAACDD